MFIKVLKHSPRKSSRNLPVEKKDEGRRVPELSFFSPAFLLCFLLLIML